MSRTFTLMIQGVTSSSDPIDVISPYDGRVLASVATADKAAVEVALDRADSLFRDRAGWLGAESRAAVLEKTARLMSDAAEDLANEAAAEGGKPLIDSRVEVARAIDGVHLCLEALRHQHGTEIPMGINAASANRLAMTRREPIGVVVAVSAFNHPLNLIVHQVGPAVASGCPVIVKPAEDTPLSCLRFVELLYRAGLPEAWCQVVVTRDLSLAEKLVTDKRLGFFSFIGSARVGWMLRSKLAPGVRCSLEHGGAAPAIVAADADLDLVLPLLLKGGFYHAGQVCVSVQRVFAEEAVAAKVAKLLAKGAGKLKVGDPNAPETEVGPLIRPREAERVDEWVREAVDGGAKLLCGGKRLDHNCYSPTVLVDPPPNARVSTHEIFGPVVCVYSYRDVAEAFSRANSLDTAFQAAVFTSNVDLALRCYRELDASAIMVNDHTAFRVDWMPFAGLRTSGLSVGGIGYTMHDMQIEKMLVMRSQYL